MIFPNLRQEGSCLLSSSSDTFALGGYFAKILPYPSTLLLSGNLGAGKTTFSKGFIQTLTDLPDYEITSPTFTLMNLYDTPQGPLAHLDLYRLKTKEAFDAHGFDEQLHLPITHLIEWPEILLPFSLPHWSIQLDITGSQRTLSWRTISHG